MDNERKGIVMKLTVSVIEADIGSIGGDICPSERLFEDRSIVCRNPGPAESFGSLCEFYRR